jgi:PAS domain S-box-containing protein
MALGELEPHGDCPAARRLQAFVATSDEIVFELALDGTITYVSPSVSRHLGYDPVELVGQSWQAITPSTEHERGTELLARCADGEQVWDHQDYVFTTKAGHLRSLWSTGVGQLDAGGSVVGFAGTLHPKRQDGQEDEGLRRWIRAIIDRRRIQPVFQPILDLRRETPIGAEALSRFPTELARTPAQMFTDAAALGLGTELELTALDAALGAAYTLPESVFVSVNVSPETVLSGELGPVLDRHDWARERLVLEITEQVPVHEYGPIGAALGELGCRLAVDDAGAGYASFRHILALAPELIKLDRFLVTDVDVDAARRALIRSVVAFAAEVRAEIIAEGIESASVARTLRELGVQYGQGYHFGSPAPVTRTMPAAARRPVRALASGA